MHRRKDRVLFFRGDGHRVIGLKNWLLNSMPQLPKLIFEIFQSESNIEPSPEGFTKGIL